MEDSNEWKRPSDVMNLRRKRKSMCQKKIVTADEERTSVIYRSPTHSKKRKNPFLCSQSKGSNKRPSLGNKENNQNKAIASIPNDNALFDFLDNQKKEEKDGLLDEKCIVQSDKSQSEIRQVPQSVDSQSKERTQKVKKQSTSGSTSSTAIKGAPNESDLSSTLPVDWCLKTKLRVVSSRSLQWCVQLKTSDEAHGVTGFAQSSQSKNDSVAERQKEFHMSGMYWVHPHLPWVRLFPRIIDDPKTSKTSGMLLQEDIQASLQADWEESFTSAYYQLRSGLCPYFYLCTHMFTVLFRGNASAQSKMVAMITPTTRGFRESLEIEGIQFTLPVSEKRQAKHKETMETEARSRAQEVCVDSHKTESEKKTTFDEDDEDVMATDEGASGWLESIGLDKKEFPSLDPRRVKLQREGFRAIDHRPESLVWVDGPNVQALFNFLLNCRTCTASSGTQAGVPPTILSPCPFKGATLRSHKKKHTVIKQSDKDGNITHAHILEIAGPLLPQHTSSLISLLHRSQGADFGMTFSNHDPTVPFNILPFYRTNNSKGSNSYTAQTEVQENRSRDSQVLSSQSGVVDKEFRTNSDGVQNISVESEVTEDITDCTKSTEGENDLNRKSSMNSQSNSPLSSKTSSSGSSGSCLSTNSPSLSQHENTKECIDTSSLIINNNLFEYKPLSDRVCAIKELVCMPAGFTWST